MIRRGRGNSHDFYDMGAPERPHLIEDDDDTRYLQGRAFISSNPRLLRVDGPPQIDIFVPPDKASQESFATRSKMVGMDEDEPDQFDDTFLRDIDVLFQIDSRGDSVNHRQHETRRQNDEAYSDHKSSASPSSVPSLEDHCETRIYNSRHDIICSSITAKLLHHESVNGSFTNMARTWPVYYSPSTRELQSVIEKDTSCHGARTNLETVQRLISEKGINQKEPQMVLTLTSYPFRIFHATESLINEIVRKCRRSDKDVRKIVGDSFQSVFQEAHISFCNGAISCFPPTEVVVAPPCISTMGRIASPFGVTLSSSSSPSGSNGIVRNVWILGHWQCQIQIQQVFADVTRPDQGLLYYAITVNGI